MERKKSRFVPPPPCPSVRSHVQELATRNLIASRHEASSADMFQCHRQLVTFLRGKNLHITTLTQHFPAFCVIVEQVRPNGSSSNLHPESPRIEFAVRCCTVLRDKIWSKICQSISSYVSNHDSYSVNS